MADVNLQVQINLLENINSTLKGLNASFDSFAKTASDSVKGVETGFTKVGKSFSALGLGIIAVNQGLELLGKVYNTIIPYFKEAIKEAADQEKQESLLANAMRQRGLYTKDLYDQNLRLADSLQVLSIYQDDQILNAERILLQLGVEQNQLESVTKATMDFATAKGMDLSSASEVVAKSIGTSTNALKRYGIEIDNSLKGTARAAAIVSELNKVFGGSSAAAANTYSGSIAQLGNMWKELLEQLGNYVIKNSFVVAAIKEAGKVLKELIGIVSDNREGMIKFVNEGIIYLFESLSSLLGILPSIGSAMAPLLSVFSAWDVLIKSILVTILSIMGIPGKIAKAMGMASQASKDLESLIQSIGESALTSAKDINNTKLAFDATAKASDFAKNKIDEYIKKLKELNVEKSKGSEVQAVTQPVLLSFTETIVKAFKVGAESLIQSFQDMKLTDVSSAVAGGKGGAEKMLQGMTKTAGTAIGAAFGSPEAGAAIGEIVGLMGKSTEEFSKMINGFIEGLAGFIPNIMRNVPVLIQALVNAIPLIVRGLNEALPILMEGLVAMLSDPKFWESVINALFEVMLLTMGNPMFWIQFATAFIKAVIMNIPAMVNAFITGISNSIGKAFANIGKVFSDSIKVFSDAINIFKDAVNAVPDLIGDAGKGIGGFFGGIGGAIGGAVGSVGKFFGLAEGGTVPTSPAYSNDKFGPVMLSGGENVMDYSTNQKLNAYLDNQANQEKSISINLQVGEKDLASVMLALNQRGFRTA